jgi:hypothetical protein
VVHVIVSDVLETFVAVTADMTGFAEVVVNVALGDVEVMLVALAETTAKS